MTSNLRRLATALLAPLLALAPACDSDTSHRADTHTNQGRACLEAASDDPLAPLEPGTDTRVRVVIDDCAASGSPFTASCNTTVQGQHIQVTSRARVDFDYSPFPACGLVETTCPLGPLPAGDYLLEHGTETSTITLPGPGSCTPAALSDTRDPEENPR